MPGRVLPLAVALAAAVSAAPAAAASYSQFLATNTDTWTTVGGNAVDGGDIGVDTVRYINNDDTAWWSASTRFFLPADYTNAKLSVMFYSADDRSVLLLNGARSPISIGIGAPGNGKFRFTAGGADVGWKFTYANGELNSPTLGQGFVAGNNTVTLVVNNTNSGIGGATAAPGPSKVGFAAILRFDSNLPPPIPEPATWLLMLAGFAGIGVRLRARQAVSVNISRPIR